MGKRKYHSAPDGPPEKNKKDTSEEDQSDDTNSQPQNVTKTENIKKERSMGTFDVKYFRKELTAKQGQNMVLTQFLQVCLNPDNEVDYLLEYLKNGGNSHEILRQINQESKINLTLTTPAFHLFHLIILKVQSSLPHMIAITEEACRYFLNNFMSTVEIMISENSGPRHRKVVLKLLTSMVMLNADLGIEVLNQAPLTTKHLQHIVEKANYKEKDNVRTAFVHFITSFLVEGHLPLIKALLEKQGLLGLVIPGLLHDDAEAVLMFLNILKTNVVDSVHISKSLKLKTFSHQILHNMFKIFSWKGPPELDQEIRNEARPEIIALITNIILTLFTSHKLGLYFIDNSLGTADSNKNQNLYKTLLTLKRPWENETECKVILDIVYKCPDLHRAVINIIEQSFEPQHSPLWERTTQFTIKLLNKLKPEDMVLRMSNLNPTQVVNFIRFVTLPVPLLKLIQLNMGKDNTISLYCVRVLVKMLQTLKQYMQILEMEEIDTVQIVDLKNKLDYFFPKHLPAPGTLVILIDDIVNNGENIETSKDYKLPKISDTDSLIYLIDLLLLYNDIHPAFFETLEGSIDMNKILNCAKAITDAKVPLLKFKVVSLWLTLDNSAISLKNPMFKELLLIMLEVYMSDNENVWMEAKPTLHMFLKNTAIFETDEDEIHLILYTLRNVKVNPPALIGEIIQYILENIKDLSDYVKNQLVHFEISDENSAASLDTLFNDLMDNRNTKDSVFLENKIPSYFIVGCMQYYQTNKGVGKSLKHFVSLYIVNLLHSNYSPELTEVLIGDSKLDIRSYVASWIGQPVSVPDNVVEDNVLRNMSKSIIEEENIFIRDVFQFLDETSIEEGEITIDNVAYKINVTKNVDSSELLIWAKYILFCAVRLTNMEQLTEEKCKKIANYYHCMVLIAKKYHMVDICKTILLALFKNPQILKIYKPLDLNKGESNLLITKLILQVITQQQNIINNLNNKHKILKLYQQKNYNEIIKALIKINKRKTVNSKHTIEVLEVVGLSREDDIRIFNQIFSLEIESCLKDEKEPNLAVDLLQHLVEKYSKMIVLEIQPHILKKCMILYTDLLTYKNVSPNLTNMEMTLIEYFENKPHQTMKITEDIFTKFFQTSSTRKTTFQLASVLLRYSFKFCQVFKKHIISPETLSQRELTLPLGEAVIGQKQSLHENKEFLSTVYNEYKSNINKYIEKPHKAGQIYISNWKFIRKLILECMDYEECEKVFNKVHKFEIIELNHLNLFQTIFLKLYLSEKTVKIDYFINYLLSMVHLTMVALKEEMQANIVDDIISYLNIVVSITNNMEDFNKKEKDALVKITENTAWQNFCKAVLKDSLKIKTVDQGHTVGPKLLSILTHLVKLLYPYDHEDITTIFEMVTSHSEFLNVMLSHHSTDIKSTLIEFLYTLVSKNKSVMKAQQIAVYLSAYHATRSPCDRLILAILHFYETNGIPVNEYKPYMWGDSAANYYAVRKNRAASLWAQPTPNQVLNLYEKDIIEETVRNFPVTQTLDYHYELPSRLIRSSKDSIKFVIDEIYCDGVSKTRDIKDIEAAVNNLKVKAKYDKIIPRIAETDLVGVSHLVANDKIYDPVFLFPLLSHLLAPGSVASCFKLLRTGLLSVPVMALSSHCPMMRAAAYHVLHRFCLLLETETRHKNDKLYLTDFINTLRQSLTTAIDNTDEVTDDIKGAKNPKLPAIDALYLARTLMVSTSPSDPLYKPVNNFLIAKQFVDLTVVPDFLSLFHDSEVESNNRRLWILEVIRDGVKTMTDLNVIFKTMCLKMIMDFYSSTLSDRKVKERIISVLTSIVSIPRAFEILTEGYGLMSWLHSTVRQLGKDERNIIKEVFALINNAVYSMIVNSLAKNLAAKAKTGKVDIDIKVNKDIEQEILVILYDLLKNIDHLEIEDVVSYVKIYKLISKSSLKSLDKKQMLNLVNKVDGCVKDCENIKLLTRVLVNNEALLLNSKHLDITLQCPYKDVLVKDLIYVVRAYIL